MKKWLAGIILRLLGWRLEGERPEAPAYLLASWPHTSNVDFFFFLLLCMRAGVAIRWVGKHTLFRGPMNWIMRRLGGLPIDRRSRNNAVDGIVSLFREHDELALAIAPEGTRSWVPYWKSGFYYVARQAEIPIVLGYLDFRSKRGGFGPTLTLSGDPKSDMDEIRAFYADKVGKHPKNSGPLRLRLEDQSTETIDAERPFETDGPAPEDSGTHAP